MQIYSVIYRIVLVCLFVLQFVARFLVGVAGHNPPTTTTEYIVMALAAITFIALTVHARSDKPAIKRPAKYISLALVSVGAIATVYELITILPGEDRFYIIPLVIGGLFILLSVAVCLELLKKT